MNAECTQMKCLEQVCGVEQDWPGVISHSLLSGVGNIALSALRNPVTRLVLIGFLGTPKKTDSSRYDRRIGG